MPKKKRKGYYVNGTWVTAGSDADRALRAELVDADAPSRSAKKRASEALQQLGEKLVFAHASSLSRLTLPDELQDALVQARSITSFGARRRQMQLIGRLMRQLDDEAVGAIRAALSCTAKK